MKSLPKIGDNGRRLLIACLAGTAFGQAIAAGFAAFSVRDVFKVLRNGNTAEAYPEIAVILAAGFIIGGFRLTERVLAEQVGLSYAADLRERLFLHISRLPLDAVSRKRRGGLTLRFVGDLSAIRNWVGLGISRTIAAAIIIPVTIGLLISIDPKLGAAATLPLAIGLVLMTILGWRLAPVHRALRHERSRLALDLSERIPLAPQLRLMGRMPIERKVLKRRNGTLLQAARRRAAGRGGLDAIVDAVASCSAGGILLTAVMTGAPLANVAASLAALSIAITPMRRLSGVWDQHRAWRVAAQKCARLLSMPALKGRKAKTSPDLQTTQAETNPTRTNEHAATLTYDGLVLSGLRGGTTATLSATIDPGTKLAVIGRNGSGKSQLLTISAGLQRATGGRVLIDGRPPTPGKAAQDRHTIVYLSKTTPILNGSVRRALTMQGATDCDDVQIHEALETYGLETCVAAMGGLDGRISENGQNLSTGERRRLLMVRAALARPQLLILDGIDDALDPEGVERLGHLLRATPSTILMTTHNPWVARQADRVWLLDDATLRDDGAAPTCFNTDGPIRDFFNLSCVA